jgi:hypothetical protein
VTVVGPSLKVVLDVIAYVLVVAPMPFTLIDVDDTAVTTPPAKFAGEGGVADVDVVLSRGEWLEVAEAMPAPPATNPTPSAVVAATRFTAMFFLLMMFLSLRSLETISNRFHRCRVS